MAENEFDRWVDEQVGPDPTAQDLFAFAQQWEEIADSHGGADGRYDEADQLWARAFEAAEREGGAVETERLARLYGWSTPVSREAGLNRDHGEGYAW